MTIKQVKEEEKKQFNKDSTDEQVQAYLDASFSGELQDDELADVAGGDGNGWDIKLTVSCSSCGWFARYWNDPRKPVDWKYNLMKRGHGDQSPNCSCFTPVYTEGWPEYGWQEYVGK